MRKVRVLALVGALAVGLLVVAAMACSDDKNDGGEVEVIDTPGAEADPEADPTADSTVEGGREEAPDGVVEEQPEGSESVRVTLQEWSVLPEFDSVAAGEVYFLVANTGPEDAHEFVVIKTDEDPANLPTEDGKVPEDQVDLIDEIEPFAIGTQASLTLNLEPGSYALICNIAEEENGELESHYENGMHAAFTVE